MPGPGRDPEPNFIETPRIPALLYGEPGALPAPLTTAVSGHLEGCQSCPSQTPHTQPPLHVLFISHSTKNSGARHL